MKDYMSVMTEENKSLLAKIIGDAVIPQEKTFDWVRDYLMDVYKKNQPSVEMRIDRAKLRDDLDDLERCFVKADSFDSDGAGYNNGYRENMVENRQIEKMKIREKLEKLTLENMLLDKQNESAMSDCKAFINLLDSESCRNVLTLQFIKCLSPSAIADELFLAYASVRQYRNRGIKQLSHIVDAYIVSELLTKK